MKIYTREELGTRPFRNPRRYVPIKSRKWFIIHYPGLGTPPRSLAAYRRWIEGIHMDQNNWSTVGYNYFIAPNGDTGEGCGRDVVGAHSPPHNVDGIGVNIWTSNGQPTKESLQAARNLYELLCKQAGHRLSIGWHGMDYPTLCPGDTLRSWAKSGMPVPGGAAGTPAPTTPAPAPQKELIMEPIRKYGCNKKRTITNKRWHSLALNNGGAVSLAAGPANVSATVQLQAVIPEGCTLAVRFYTVNYKKGSKTKVVTTYAAAGEAVHTAGKTYLTVPYLDYIGNAPAGWSRRLRVQVMATGGNVTLEKNWTRVQTAKK